MEHYSLWNWPDGWCIGFRNWFRGFDNYEVPTLVLKVWKNNITFSRLKKFEKKFFCYMLICEMKISFQTYPAF